jgi:small subunit ribosomal protein S16
MAVKIRLQRHGRKGKPFYHVVVADARAPRDGRFIERIGSYNPNTNPATIELDNDKALDWLFKGAQPTDTARAILSYKGVMMRQYLDRGVKMGKHTQEEADSVFDKWVADKEAKIEAKRTALKAGVVATREERMAAETKVSQERAKVLANKRLEAANAAAAAATPESETAEVAEEAAE